jgi:Leucine-rich repeat (LRR) protein
MEEEVRPDLLEALVNLAVEDLDDQTKATLRQTSKHLKAAVDATVLSCLVDPDDLHKILDCNWPNITSLEIEPNEGKEGSTLRPGAFISLLCALVLKFPLLTRLSLDKCTTLAALPTNIGELSHLKEFMMSACTRLTAFPPSFGQLTALEKLEICGCTALTLKGLAPLKHLRQLRYLKIDGKPVDDPRFTKWICKKLTTSLQHLDLSSGLSSWPPSLGNFKHLTSLMLDQDESSEIPESIGLLTTLKKFALFSDEEPATLPPSFSKLTALENMSLRTTDMDSIGPLQHISGLKCLRLDVVDADIPQYPSFIWNLTSLTALQLYNDRLRELPAEIGQLKQLKYLQIDFERLQTIPESFGELFALTTLRMRNLDALQRLPESFSKLVSLKHLYFIHCLALANLPESLGNLTSLESLEIAHCYSLCTLPLSLGKLKSLKRLVVAHSGLTKLPETIGQLSALEELSVIECDEFAEIPESFPDLIWGKAYGEWPLKIVTFSECPELAFSSNIKNVLEFMKHHGVYQEESEEYKELDYSTFWIDF